MLYPEKHILSKSTFVRGAQCVKSLYLYKNHYDLRDKISPNQQMLFRRGTEVGILAQGIFPGGVDASPRDIYNFQESVVKTKQLLAEGKEIIYEAAFQFDGVLAALDILVKSNGKWYAYEVKSSAKVSGAYITDAALQYYVITNSGLPLANFSIINLNTDYVKNGPLELRKLFNAHSVINDVVKKQVHIREKIAEAKGVLTNNVMPDMSIGKHCFEPYSCDFMGQCWKAVPTNSIFELTGMQREKQFELYNSGIKTIPDIPISTPLKTQQKLQVDFYEKNEPYVDKAGISQFLNELEYPLYFMDFETFMPAVPIFDNTSPFQHLPFQYSLHLKKSKSAEPLHMEFLAEAGMNPCKLFIDNLLSDTAEPGNILVYNLSFEKSVMKKLKKMFPEHSDAIQNRISRMRDLMKPFEENLYYHHKMKGSFSIKNVLPALVPELSYSELSINNGNAACVAFEQLQSETDILKIAEIRSNLKEYCKLDTYAMVKILEVLEAIV